MTRRHITNIRPRLGWMHVAILGLQVGDPAAVLLAATIAYWVHVGVVTSLPQAYTVLVGFAVLLTLMIFNFSKVYLAARIADFWTSAARAWLLWLLVIMVLACGGYLIKPDVFFSRFWSVAWAGLTAAFMLLFRSVFAILVDNALERGKLHLRVAIVGADEAGLHLYKAWSNVSHTIKMVGLFDDRRARFEELAKEMGVPITGDTSDLIELAKAGAVDTVVLNIAWTGERRLREMIEFLQAAAIDIQLVPGSLGFVVGSFDMFRNAVAANIGGVPLFTVVTRPIDDWGWLIKRVTDTVLVLLALPLLTPICLLIGAAIKLDSPGTVLFRQERGGFNGQTFWVYKFRTMHMHLGQASGEVRQAQRGDSRITRVGAFLRRTSLDELPQLINVLRGEMALVGPRPHALSHDQHFARTVQRYYSRHRVLPGMTGWAQINGMRGEVGDEEQIKRRTALDLYYVENWSLGFDFRILFTTPMALIKHEAY